MVVSGGESGGTTQMSSVTPGDETCLRCGSSLRYVGKRQNADGGHHGHHSTVFECPTCEREVLRG